ncbi:hypothetical protein MX054_002104 [Enterobacter cloacae]|nr:hypothetical protein [Enterobacter cloacae]
MSTITRERAQEIFLGNGPEPTASEERELARIALASLEAEAVGEVVLGEYDDCGCHPDARVACIAADGQADWENFKDGTRLYTAPPAPVSVPDAVDYSDLDPASKDREIIEAIAECKGWNACRAAMLQGAEPVTTAYKLPMQPLVIDAHGTLRFKENPIVRKLLDYATEHGYGLNEIALDEFEAEDQMQLAQLIGYSLSGYGTLSYVTDESYDRAAAAAPQQEVK